MVKKTCISFITIKHDLDKNISLNRKIDSKLFYGSSNSFKSKSKIALNDHYYVVCKISKSFFFKPFVLVEIAWFWIIHFCYWIQRHYFKICKHINGKKAISR